LNDVITPLTFGRCLPSAISVVSESECIGITS
jgi:hypothetical protein